MNNPREGSGTIPHRRIGPPSLSSLHVALLGERTLCSAFLRLLLRESDENISTIDVASGLARLPKDGVNVAVLPLLSPQAGALSEVSETAAALGRIPLVVLIDRGDPQIIDQLVSRGVRGVLTFDVEAPVVAAALRLVNAGGIYVPAQQPGAALAPAGSATHDMPVKGRLDRLSPRERAVLDLLRRSLSNREIAEALTIAEATVKIHVRNLLRKTRARNRVELALLAARSSH
jgi:DNA-binding NarL/FixJ family response regulator